MNIHTKLEHSPVKQNARPIPLRLQESVGPELNRLIETGHIEKINDVDEDSFVSLAVITIKMMVR